jgi:hypothetical protein
VPVEAATPEELAALAALITQWAEGEHATNDLVAAVDRDPETMRWYVRLNGENKRFITVWLTLRERTLHYETQFMPAPEENIEECFEFLLRVNARLYGMRFALGAEDAVYLLGQMPVTAVDGDELDRLIGSSWTYVEQYFPTAMSLGYASQYRRPARP